MATKITKNSFQGGMDKDTDPRQLPANKYTDAYMASISVDGKEGQLSAFKGIEELVNVVIGAATVDADHTKTKVMGIFEGRFLLGGTETLMALVFLYRTDSRIYNILGIKEDGTYYEMYTKTLTVAEDAEMAANGRYFVDCKIYKESGTSYAYFTDGVFEPKKLPLVITAGGKGDGAGGGSRYADEEIELIRTGFRGNISAVSVLAGGDLLCGTYQFALRLINDDQNKYTKWSLLTQPAFIGLDATTTEKSYGGVGFVSTNKIRLTLSTVVDYTSLYTHYQLAVVENINGGEDSNLTVKVLQPVTLVDMTGGVTAEYSSNKPAKELVSIDEVTVDDAQIKTFSTLEIKNNRLIPANIKYHPLDYDNGNGDPVVGGTTAVIKRDLSSSSVDSAVGYRDADNATNYVGYFRDELYRFGVVYEDKYGNFSKPKVLDFNKTNVSANSAAVDSPDFRFPPRSNSTYGSLLGGTNDHIQALGLDIKGLQNHPSWAIAAHIVRVPRKKKIQFQTPLVPSILVQPAKAQGDYPDQQTISGQQSPDPLNVEATNPDGSYVPKNFFHIVPKSLVRYGELYGKAVVTDGSVYATNSAFSTEFKFVGSEGGTAIFILAMANEYLLYTDSTASDSNLSWTKSNGTAILAAEGINVSIQRRTIGSGTSWGSVSVWTQCLNYDTAGNINTDWSTNLLPVFDTTTYDYLINIGNES